MACQTISLLTINGKCEGSIGGIKRVLVADREKVTADVSTGSNPNSEVTSITMEEGAKFKEWTFRKNTGSYSSTIARDLKIGTCVVTTEVSLQFTKAEAEKRLAIQSAINAGCAVIIEDMYGQYIYLGLENDVEISDINMTSGTETTDLSGFTLTFQDIAGELPHFVKAGVVTDAIIESATQG